MDMVTSLKALHKLVDGRQLTSDLGGTFSYSHSDWMQFHQRLVSFLSDLQGAADLLHRAIKNIDGNPKIDTAQDVQLRIRDQKTSMKEVLEDARLVSLQREGGAILARIRREEFRFANSDDFRDALESVTVLYNQVEESVHTLVMMSNESLQHLDLVLKLREAESNLNTAKEWFNTEGERQLKDSVPSEDTLGSANQTLQHFTSFLTQAKEKKKHTVDLMTEVEKMLSSTDTERKVSHSELNALNLNMADFLLRAQQRHTDLENIVQICRFCEEATALLSESRRYLEQVETGRNVTGANLNTLKTYRDRLAACFSARHFQNVRAEAVGERSPGGVRRWNAAWMEYREVSQRLGETLERWGDVAHTDEQQPTTEEARVQIKEEDEEALQSVIRASSSPPWTAKKDDYSERAGRDQAESLPFKADARRNPGPKALSGPRIGAGAQGRRHSDADIKKGNPVGRPELFPWQHGALERSLSEGSCVSSVASSGRRSTSPPPVKHSQAWPSVAAWQNPFRPRDISDTGGGFGGRGFSDHAGVTVGDRTQEASSLSDLEAEETASNVLKLQRIMEELLLTEREYVRSLGYVREHYFAELERPDVPQDIRGQRTRIFGNLEKLHDFHRHHFLKELEGCLQEPFRVGRCFLQHSKSFGLYALYSKNKPQSDSLLISHVHDFFKQKQLQLGDKMDLSSYLLKPVQRISKYSLLLQDMVKECGPHRSHEKVQIQHALEVIQFQLRHGNNLLAMDDILDCDVNLKEQGQLIRQDEFLVSFRKKKCSRHIFLFQDLVLFSKTKKTDVGNDTYVYKQSFKTSDLGMTHNSGDSGLCFEIWFRRRKSQDTYTLQAVSREVKEAWTEDLEHILWNQAVYNREVRMQERVFMGIGNKPFMDIKPSDAAISDRAVNWALIGRESKVPGASGTSGPPRGFPVIRPNSVGSGSGSSSSGSHSSSGRGPLSPLAWGYQCGPKQTGAAGGQGHLVVLEEDDLDQERGSQNLLMGSSESSGESVSGFSSSGYSCHSAAGGEVDDVSSMCASVVSLKDSPASRQESNLRQARNPGQSTENPNGSSVPPTAPSLTEEPPTVQNAVIGTSTEV
ncbi:hypothetical protein DPEC_G00196490 [Dallia pectoralis]|uniref:Uncharacterized protein n=1 Tax=Dallia pectoralis TaxID=75939 RepID=A0ACC2G7B2_DALPE|nr:hypothetical protein DPEC_G00196490 [Dallia pectoralis]